ncbi:MAG: ornithine cyclodeaminase family protein [Rhizobiales bacterium]|nr:ornithine cyclodeaminase family protein [Hyphomicrobiales bacterium]
MRIITPNDIARVLTYPALIDALEEAFRSDIALPQRHHHTIAQPGADATLLLMPSWTESGQKFVGCKVVTVFPDNAPRGEPSLYGSYLLLSGESGEPLAVIDGRVLTAWRTACASALAARYLARADASHLVMVGAGALAPHLVHAHASVRPVTRVTLWNRTRSRAVQAAFGLAVTGIETEVTDDLETAVRDADIVSCATLAAQPLIRGQWLKKGAHVDLVGGFTPKMREADDAAIKRARVYVDTRPGAMKEAGDIVQPLRRKVITKEDIQGDLFDLCRGKVKGRRRASEITLFKSVGTAIEDLAAAMLVWRGVAG